MYWLKNGEVHDEYRIDYMKSYYEQAQLALEESSNFEAYIAWGSLTLYLLEVVKWINAMVLFM